VAAEVAAGNFDPAFVFVIQSLATDLIIWMNASKDIDVLLTDSRNVAVEEFRVMQGFGM
jgi:hypothetical protein